MTVDIRFTDYLRLTKPSDTEVTQFKEFLSAPTSARSLFIKMEASHAGFDNLNGRWYVPSRMAEGVSTFRLNEKPTKLLKHHDPESDPVGVVRGARFVPTIPDDLVDNPDVMTLMSSSAPIKTQLKAMRNLRRAGVLDRVDWRGLGYIELVGEVMDPDTISKIQDGRFDAVSTNFSSPGQVYCSICAQNVVKDGYCDHDPGDQYEDDAEDGHKFTAMYIPGAHKYKEASFVTFEGDPLVSIELVDQSNKDNNKTICLPDNWQEELQVDNLTFEFKDSVKEDTMAQPSEITLSDTEQKVFDIIKKLRDTSDDGALVELAKDIAKLYAEDGTLPDQIEAELDEETAILYALEDLETNQLEINGDETCDGMQEELVKMKEEGLLTDEEFDAADAKLSTKTRKGLSKGTFCGPKRSFPVPDCAHVTAARRLIGRYKGPGNKSSILACVSRKAKALGCGGKKDNLEPDTGDVTIVPCAEDTLKDLKDEELRNLFHATELMLIERKVAIKRECSDCAVHSGKTEEAQRQLGEARDEMKKSEDILRALRYELRQAYSDYEQQVGDSVVARVEARTEKAQRLALVGVLTQKYDSLETGTEALKDVDLGQEEAVIMDSFDLEAVTSRLTDGMSRDPNEGVADPTLNPDGDNPQLPTGLSKPALEAIGNIKTYIKDGQVGIAKQLYATMKAMNEFTDEITFESLSADTTEAAEE
ncbi:MAG: hypothetical protein ACXABY_10955 [Candidatus Thorarchaeota archaeon]|jgi:hypothetical protein